MSNGDLPPAEPAPQPSANVDPSARHQARAALITAIVALVSAILGPLISLKINSDQIDSQAVQFREEAASNSEQSESEFVRTQRTEAYTAFLTAFNDGTLDLIGAAGAFEGAGGTQGLAEQTQKAVDAVKAVTATYYEVRIVASEDANEKAEALYTEFAGWSGDLLVAGSKVVSGEPLTAEEQQLLASTSETYQTLLGLSIEFIESGRTDMATDEREDD